MNLLKNLCLYSQTQGTAQAALGSWRERQPYPSIKIMQQEEVRAVRTILHTSGAPGAGQRTSLRPIAHLRQSSGIICATRAQFQSS